MSEFYSHGQRVLQDRFDTRRLADLELEALVHDCITEEEQSFIESRDMFFLATCNAQGQPTVSYKGGAPGFVRVLTPRELVFPCYDGNGMFCSMGNIADRREIGMLFIDFETPRRLRLQGTAALSDEPVLTDAYPECQFVVCVQPCAIFVNCARYIHRYRKVADSEYVPHKGRQTPFPAWKRIDLVQDALPRRDQGRAEQVGGTITQQEYFEKVAKGTS
jgi:hypothetical protein